MADSFNKTRWIAQGTVIALLTWLVLAGAKDYFGRSAALALAIAIFLAFVLALWARGRTRAAGPPRQ